MYFNKHSILVSYNIYGMRTIIITDDEWAFTGCDFYFEISIFFQI